MRRGVRARAGGGRGERGGGGVDAGCGRGAAAAAAPRHARGLLRARHAARTEGTHSLTIIIITYTKSSNTSQHCNLKVETSHVLTCQFF